MDQQPNINNIEILKAARRQVIPDGNRAPQTGVSIPPSFSDEKGLGGDFASSPIKTRPPTFSDETLAYDVQEIRENLPRKITEEKNFVEGLLQKLQALAVEEQTIKNEKEQFDKIWAGLEEKRQKLETRLAAINRVKGKLMALNQEVEDIIS